MKHKELVRAIALKLDLPEDDAERMLQTTVNLIIEQLVEGNSVHFQGFGAFEFKRREERISVHPSSQKRTLIPPKQIVYFRPSAPIKNRLKTLNHE